MFSCACFKDSVFQVFWAPYSQGLTKECDHWYCEIISEKSCMPYFGIAPVSENITVALHQAASLHSIIDCFLLQHILLSLNPDMTYVNAGNSKTLAFDPQEQDILRILRTRHQINCHLKHIILSDTAGCLIHSSL